MSNATELVDKLKRVGNIHEANVVQELIQQRAELLEALKEARKELELYAECAGDDPYNNPMLNEAITKAEAAE